MKTYEELQSTIKKYDEKIAELEATTKKRLFNALCMLGIVIVIMIFATIYLLINNHSSAWGTIISSIILTYLLLDMSIFYRKHYKRED